MEAEWQDINGITRDFPYKIWLEEMKEQEYIRTKYTSMSSNLIEPEIIEPFIVVFRSKPIQRNSIRINGQKP